MLHRIEARIKKRGTDDAETTKELDMEWIEVAAPSIETAKEMALESLGVDESDAELKIVHEGKIGLFGRVKEEARIRARVLPSTSASPKNKTKAGARRSRAAGRRSRPSGGRSRSSGGRSRSSGGRSNPSSRRRNQASRGQPGSAGKRSHERSARNSARKRSSRGSGSSARARAGSTREKENATLKESKLSLAEQADLAESFVKGIADVVGLSLDFTRYDLEDDIMRIEVSGDELGVLVGYRGATARSIDSLVRTVLQRSGGTTREGKIRVDIGGLKARRQDALVDFAKSVVSEVLESGEGVRFEPMNRLDRKIVHDMVSEIEGVESYSEGNDPMRYVVINASPVVVT